jgi:hypothetical protein
VWGRDRNLEKTNADNISLCSLKARSLSFLITEDEGEEEEEEERRLERGTRCNKATNPQGIIEL